MSARRLVTLVESWIVAAHGDETDAILEPGRHEPTDLLAVLAMDGEVG